MESSRYNVMGDPKTLQRLLAEMPDVELDEKFAANDWNVCVPTETVDKFVDWCDAAGVKEALVY